MVGVGNNILEKIKSYTPEGYCNDDIVVTSAKGSYYIDINNKKYLDFTSGIFTNTFGHCYPPLINAEIKQIKKCDNIHGRRSIVEGEFYSKLSNFMPLSDYKFIPYNDGGYAIDRGLTDIINYYDKKRIPIGAFRGGFHGKTMATKLTINETAKATFFDNFQIEYPNCYRCPYKKQYPQCKMCCIKETCNKLQEKKAKAIIFEPIQGAGVIIPPQGFWQKIFEYCQKNKIIMFADEVLTGGGRIGSFLASYGHYGITPDIISLTKGLANGRPLSVLCEREYITDNPYAKRPMERSSTFASHPTNLAVASKCLELIEKENILTHVQNMGNILTEELQIISRKYNDICTSRSIGLMGAIEFVKTQTTKEPDYHLCNMVFNQARKLGLEVILSGNILRIAPPLNISKKDLIKGIKILDKSIKESLS